METSFLSAGALSAFSIVECGQPIQLAIVDSGYILEMACLTQSIGSGIKVAALLSMLVIGYSGRGGKYDIIEAIGCSGIGK